MMLRIESRVGQTVPLCNLSDGRVVSVFVNFKAPQSLTISIHIKYDSVLLNHRREPFSNAIARLAASAGTRSSYDDRDPYLVGGNAEAFLRALYLQLSLGTRPPQVRSDLLLVVVDALKSTNRGYLVTTGE